MKILGVCFPNDLFYISNNESTIWFGQGVWSSLRILELINDDLNLEMITELSPSNTTHPIIQTVQDAKVDIAPIEVGKSYTIQPYNHIPQGAGRIVDLSKKYTDTNSCTFWCKMTLGTTFTKGVLPVVGEPKSKKF